MKLSEAILLGSTMHRQTFGSLWETEGLEIVGSCALGAAMLAAKDFNCRQWTFLNNDFECPVCGIGPEPFLGNLVIAHLNDVHRWTREKIAEWVATIEPKEEQKQEVKENKLEEVCV